MNAGSLDQRRSLPSLLLATALAAGSGCGSQRNYLAWVQNGLKVGPE